MSEDSRFGANSGTPAEHDAAGQDYGFFAGSPVGPPSPFGGPPAQVAAPAWQAGAPAYPPQPPVPAPRSGLPWWAVVVICVPLTVVVLGIIAAVAIPVFLNQREKAVAASTTVTMPTQIAGLATSVGSSPALEQQAAAMLTGMPDVIRAPQAAIFTDTAQTHVVAVSAGKFSLVANSADRAAFVRGFWHGIQSSAVANNLGTPETRDAGRLGGTLSCAAISGPAASGQICIAVDPGAMVITEDVYRGVAADPSFPATVREAIVHRP